MKPLNTGQLIANRWTKFTGKKWTKYFGIDNVPTAKEAGLNNFDVSSMFGVLAPAGTPADRIKVITDSLQKALGSKELQDALLNQGVVAGYQNPENAQKSINDELAKWANVIQKAGIKAE